MFLFSRRLPLVAEKADVFLGDSISMFAAWLEARFLLAVLFAVP